jgi:hypothetical protein
MQYVDPATIHASAAAGAHTYPLATFKPIPEAATQLTIRPWSFILHTMAGPGTTSPEQLWNYINRSDVGGEPHLLLGYTSFIQAVPFNVRADNNAKANSWTVGTERRGAVSVETQDNGSATDPGIAKAPWNLYQVEHLAGVAAFLNLRYGIPLRRCPAWDSPGVDGHRAHAEWSIYVGKTCPGQTRWNQIPTILTLAAEIVAWTPPIEEDDMKDSRLWRPKGFQNIFIITPAGNVLHASAALLAAYQIPTTNIIEDDHPQTLVSMLALAGLDASALVKV